MTPEQNLHVKSLVGRSDVFNYVIAHLRTQGEKSVVDYGALLGGPSGETMCAYRGIDQSVGVKETMCAVGALIADDEYDPSWEGCPFDELIGYWNVPESLRTRLDAHFDMLVDLQTFHDSQLSYTEEGTFTQRSESIVEFLRERWNIQ